MSFNYTYESLLPDSNDLDTFNILCNLAIFVSIVASLVYILWSVAPLVGNIHSAKILRGLIKLERLARKSQINNHQLQANKSLEGGRGNKNLSSPSSSSNQSGHSSTPAELQTSSGADNLHSHILSRLH